MTRAADVRFYFDADILGLAHIVCGLRTDCTYPGDAGMTFKGRTRPACPITSHDTKDTIWVPEVSSRGWLIITRDSRILQHRAEIAAVKGSGARLLALSGEEARGTWDQLEVLMTRWRSIEALLSKAGPFAYTVTRTSLKAVPLT